MRITYLDHSGFYIEGDSHCLLFDYYRGNLPSVPSGKQLLVFASHHHPDHYVPEIFTFGEQTPNTIYYLGCDITLSTANRQKMGISDDVFSRCRRMHKDDVLTYHDVRVQALRSTDMGVAFYLECEGKKVYFAGDNNLWIWHEDANFDRAQINRFYEEIEKLRGLNIDYAFLPLDPRLGEEFWRGFDAFARLIDPKWIFPMHMVDDYDIIRRMKSLPCSQGYRNRIIQIQKNGESFDL